MKQEHDPIGIDQLIAANRRSCIASYSHPPQHTPHAEQEMCYMTAKLAYVREFVSWRRSGLQAIMLRVWAEACATSLSLRYLTVQKAWEDTGGVQSTEADRSCYLQDLLDDKLPQDGCLNELLEVEAEFTEDADCKETKDRSRCAQRISNASGHGQVGGDISSCRMQMYCMSWKTPSPSDLTVQK